MTETGGANAPNPRDLEDAVPMRLAKRLGLTIHVRLNGVIELKDKRTRRIVGGSELRKRMGKLDD